jgi:hypothetical protein
MFCPGLMTWQQHIQTSQRNVWMNQPNMWLERMLYSFGNAEDADSNGGHPGKAEFCKIPAALAAQIKPWPQALMIWLQRTRIWPKSALMIQRSMWPAQTRFFAGNAGSVDSSGGHPVTVAPRLMVQVALAAQIKPW